jgi:TonB-dependent receptor
MDIRDYQYDRTRYGFAGSMDYKLREGSGIYLRGLYSTFRNWGTSWKYTLNDFDTPNMKQDLRRPNMAVANLVTGGKDVFANSWFSWDLSAGRSRALGGNAGNADVKYKWAGDSSVATNCFNDQSVATSVNRPGWSAGCFTPGTTDVMNESNYKVSEFNLAGQGISAQVNLQGSASYAKNYHAGSHFGTLEFGGKIRNAHKFDNSYDSVADLSGLSKSQLAVSTHVLAGSDWASGFTDPNFYDGTYKMGTHLVDFGKLRSWMLANAVFPALNDPSNAAQRVVDLTGNFDLVERVAAGYVMNTIDLSPKMRLVTGLRVEHTYVDTLSYDATQSLLALTYKLNNSYTDLLPSASLRYALDKDSGLRLVYGRGLVRPDPEMLTTAVGDTGNSQAGQELYTKGNPKLKSEYADNIDVLYERYFKPVGIFQAGYFYKYIHSPQIQVVYPITSGTLAGQGDYQEWENAQSAHVQGIEIGFQQHLSYLPGPMRFLGVSANYSYTQSQIQGFADPTTGFAYRTDKPAMLRQAPNTWNVSPTFDTKKFSMRLGMTYNDKMIYAYQWFDGADNVAGVKGPAGDNYLYSHMQTDVQASYKLPWGLQVYGYGLNLNNEVFGFYNGSPQYVVQREYYKPTYAGGLRYNFTRERY